MEIDLNHAVTEVESNAFCSGDCDNSSSSLSSNSSSRPPSKSTFSSYQELWHACAGSLNSLPKKGNVVVYFPQGHLEHAASASPFPPPLETPSFDLQPQIICRVVNVQLLANKENDEVYTQVALLPQPEVLEHNLEGKEGESVGQDEGGGGSFTESTPHMFCKTLTASDTSTHGGFSVPRRAAEDCFPPLDHNQQRPSQDLVAKDLHGVEWRFRHIYRGRPRRHLLTTGWSYFVSQKNLVSGDAVLFLRGEGGELRLGIRRTVRPRNGLPDSIYGNLNSCASVLSLVASAISTRSMFHVFYSPRASHPEFVVPFQKYMKSIVHPISTGMRFKMRLHIDDSPERRCSGIVTGICDLDPFRWPNSKWRCLMVKWEEDVGSCRQERFSPWEIDPSDSIPPPLNIQSSPKLKKLRSTTQTIPPNNPVSGGVGFSDFEDSVRSSKVLQGQENAGYVSPLYRRDNMNQLLDFRVQQPSARQNVTLSGIPKASISEFIGTPAIYAAFSESDRFPKVLEGQEICPLRSLKGNAGFNPSPWVNHDLSCHSINMHPRSKPNLYPLASESFRDLYYSHNDVYKGRQDCVMPSHTNGFARDNMPSNMPSLRSMIMRNDVRSLNLQNEKIAVESVPVPPTSVENLNNPKDDAFVGSMAGCKLFGFSLNGETPPNSQVLSKRSCTKVHKQGNLVGRTIDLSRLNGYDDLLIELERLFSMEGQLCDSSKGWQILYTDSENDMMAVGDDPWHEFCDVVCKIHIHTLEEVKNMTAGMLSDDTQSCLEEAPAIIE